MEIVIERKIGEMRGEKDGYGLYTASSGSNGRQHNDTLR